MDYKLGALLVISAQICLTTQARHPCLCTRNMKPVCGSNGQTYSNQCLLECEAFTSGNPITTAHAGSCGNPKPNNCICTFDYKPICGNNGQTYPNECSLNCQRSSNLNLQKAYSGPCEPSCICPAIYSPVCGSDGNIYSNDCELNCATINNPRLSIASRGPCGGAVNVVNSLHGL